MQANAVNIPRVWAPASRRSRTSGPCTVPPRGWCVRGRGKTFTPPQPRGADTASWPALLHEDPTRLWQPRDIAAHFGDITLETMYRQLNRWAASGPIHKLGPGLYAATPWSPTPLA